MTYEDVMKEAYRWFSKMNHARYYYDYNVNLYYTQKDYGRIQRALREYEEASQLCHMLYALARTMR